MCLDDEGGQRRRPDDAVWHVVIGVDTVPRPNKAPVCVPPTGTAHRGVFAGRGPRTSDNESRRGALGQHLARTCVHNRRVTRRGMSVLRFIREGTVLAEGQFMLVN
jgi:hypothetical protein